MIRLQKKSINLCVYDNEERESAVCDDVNDTILLMVGFDLVDGGTGTTSVSHRSGGGLRILCVKEVIGKYDMWYGVICKTVMSSCMSAGYSLGGGHDMVSCLDITTICL